jgi:DNA-binding HxlR family transcriptional regulator
MKNQYELPCNIAQTLNIIGDKWTLLIVHEIMLGDKSYNELLSKLTGIASNLLSGRLKSLGEDGIIKGELYQKHPPRYKYTLTEKGRDLEDVFNSIILWGSKHLDKCYKNLVDKKTGHKVEIKYYLPETKELLDKENVEAR